jgi:GNAT superfamily N-acetyltransferase
VTAEYEIISFGQGELADFEPFLRILPVSDFALDERRRWWCFDNPFGGRYALAMQSGVIAATAYVGGKPPLLISGQTKPSFEIGDTWTHEEHRRRGLFSKLVKHLVSATSSEAGTFVYGTPNSQSTPAYEKLGFHISEDDRSWLWLVGQPRGLASFNRPASPAERTPLGGKTHAISAEEYWNATRKNERLCGSSEAYFQWRFVRSPHRYKFFERKTRNGVLFAALRSGDLRGRPVVIVSEAWVDGIPADTAVLSDLVCFARDGWKASDFFGLYFKSIKRTGASRWFEATKLRAQHRILPICSIGTQQRPSAELFDRFQLSDCDIG